MSEQFEELKQMDEARHLEDPSACTGYASDYPRRCPRKALWVVDYGFGVRSYSCNRHKAVAVEFSEVTVTPYEVT